MNEKAIDVLLAEYQWVTGLLPFYRQVEMTALGGSAVLVSAVASVVAVLEAGEAPNPGAEAVLLSAAAWGPVLLLLLELMALTRIRRAGLYIRDHIVELARRLSGEKDVLRWEECTPRQLFFGDAEVSWWRRLAAESLVSSAAVVIAIFFTTLALALTGAVMHPDGLTAPVLLIGYAAALVSVCLCVYGVRLTWGHELHQNRMRAP